MNEITDKKLYESLIKYGLFSEKLPAIFDLEDFYSYCINKGDSFTNKWYSYISFESIRNVNVPRLISIPTPMAHEKLCRCLSDCWSDLQKYFQNMTSDNKYVVSRIHLRKMKGEKSLFAMNYKSWRIDGTPETDLMIGKKYVVCVDISKCFPSIYTHAIPWALVGKDIAKNNKRDKSLWYNKIDTCAQYSKNGETHGIMIGPHTSNVLSEIILCAIDKNLTKHWDYIRNIDDYCCYVNNIEETEQFLIDINRELRFYGLALNHKKTEILEIPFGTIEKWVSQLNDKSIYFQKFHPYVDYREVQAYLNYCVLLMDRNKGNASIILYGLKVLNSFNLTDNAKKFLEKTLVSYALIYPYIVPLLDEYVFEYCETDKENVTKYVNCIYDKYLEKNYFEACSYSLYYTIKHDVIIKNFNVDIVIQKKDCILLLLAWIYSKKCKDSNSLDKLKDLAKKLKDKEMDEYWIFIYECLTVGFLKEEWRKLKQANISFLSKEYQ